MALSRAAKHEQRLREAASVRVDAFSNFKPYFKDKQLDDEAPSTEVHGLSVLCLRVILRTRIPYEHLAVPTILRKRLDYLRNLIQLQGPRIMKCSKCGRFYTDREMFDRHECDPRKRPVKWL